MPRHKHGFTIIEVSLVLAIAGLILVMAFIALPALQRQTRDSKRKEDTMTFLQALKKYQQNNRGNLPAYSDNESILDSYSILHLSEYSDGYSTWENNDYDETQNRWVAFYNQYLGNDFTNPDGIKYSFLIQKNPDDAWWPYEDIVAYDVSNFENRYADFYIFLKATCQNGEPAGSNNSRNLAIVTLLESGTYCANL